MSPLKTTTSQPSVWKPPCAWQGCYGWGGGCITRMPASHIPPSAQSAAQMVQHSRQHISQMEKPRLIDRVTP